MRQEGFQIDKGHHRRQDGEQRDQHHDDAHARPVGLKEPDADQDQGIGIHHAH